MNSHEAQDRMIQLLDHADSVRRKVAPGLALKRKSQLGQFLTPAPVARFMASLFPPSTLQTCALLDAGAGVGALTCAFLDRWTAGEGFQFVSAEVEAYEIDATLRGHLETTLANYAAKLPLATRVLSGDFIHEAALQRMIPGRFTHAIMNPPYRKINSDSAHRLMLRHAGIETVNLYSAFVALALVLMKRSGQLVAIIPRSFCNGPYYRPFREFLLHQAALRQMHLFGSRTKAFKDDEVLQENVIIRLERSASQGNVIVSHSTDDGLTDLVTHEHPFDRIVFPGDPDKFIHVPTSLEHDQIELCARVSCSLHDIGVGVSTGPVVDFRLLDHIQQQPDEGTVPLLYPGHFSGLGTQWPKDGMKRGNAIKRNSDTEKWLFPNGFYTVVRRFSSKEEPRRVIAGVVRPDTFPGAAVLGFENHLNVFHEDKHGLPEELAYGLAAFLNTTAVDDHFRRFNGHTQVNATDLRLMKYPDRRTLMALGAWAHSHDVLTQTMMDDQLKKLAG
jgi:adenine-specific DNA-methyltransferase